MAALCLSVSVSCLLSCLLSCLNGLAGNGYRAIANRHGIQMQITDDNSALKCGHDHNQNKDSIQSQFTHYFQAISLVLDPEQQAEPADQTDTRLPTPKRIHYEDTGIMPSYHCQRYSPWFHSDRNQGLTWLESAGYPADNLSSN